MFRRGLIFQAECPDPHCSRANCHFLHPQAPLPSYNADDSLAREAAWKLLQDLKQLPAAQHDSYTPTVLSLATDEAPPLHDTEGTCEEEAPLNEEDEETERGVKRKWSDSQRAEEGPSKRGKYGAELAPSAPGSGVSPRAFPVPAPAPPRDVMGPLIPAKKFTVDNFLGAVSLPAAPPAPRPAAPPKSRQALSSDTCPIVPYTPNSHIDRAVRQKVVDRLYAQLTRVQAGEAVQQALDLELELYRSCQGRTSYLHQSRVLFAQLERS